MSTAGEAQRSFREIIHDNSKFPRTYASFALLMVAMFICRSLLCYWKLFFTVLFYLLAYMRIERQLQEVIYKMSTSSSYFRTIPYHLLQYFFILLGLSIVGCYYGFGFSFEKSKTITATRFSKFAKTISSTNSLNLQLYNPQNHFDNTNLPNKHKKIYFYATPEISPDNTLFSIYLTSLFQSIVLFMIASSIKCLLIGTGIIKLKVVRRGFFGVFQRFFIIIRNLAVLPIWIDFFCEPSVQLININSNSQDIVFYSHSRRTFQELMESKKPFWCLTYIVIKLFLQLWLLEDLGVVIYDYSSNRHDSYHHADESQVTDDCVICQDYPEEPVQLRCGHIFCYRCIYRWLQDHDTCPICRCRIAEPKTIEISDGYVPVATLLSPF